ncbi:hypothetical protein [Frankia sp. AvcI1]|uniref:hypothetical protein n=1 Tax=Frankia sp. AvcI1 TaxID=573496 RepID=UPI0021183E17|nr:hypothetical protein [Frankia sp. AvcI1]
MTGRPTDIAGGPSGQLDLFLGPPSAPDLDPDVPPATTDARTILRDRRPPADTLPRLPTRRAFTPAADPADDGRLLVDTRTGEILDRPPSPTRAARLAARAAEHDARLDAERQAAAERARGWVETARAALPASTPPGLQRPPAGPLGDLR